MRWTLPGTASDRRRARRGVEALEFALTFPLYLLIFFGIIEYSWYFYQRAIVADAARLACQTVGQLDPQEDDYRAAATATMIAEIERGLGITCNNGQHLCEMTFPLDVPGFALPRVVCQARTNFLPITGFLGGANGAEGGAQGLGLGRGLRLIPLTVRARSVAVFEEAD